MVVVVEIAVVVVVVIVAEVAVVEEVVIIITSTVDSRYLKFQGTLKYFEISVPRHIRFAEFRKKIIRTTTFNKYISMLLDS